MSSRRGDKDETIGLALSGGGHRALLFTLGCLLYLCDMPSRRGGIGDLGTEHLQVTSTQPMQGQPERSDHLEDVSHRQ
jgi:hypothetical protein